MIEEIDYLKNEKLKKDYAIPNSFIKNQRSSMKKWKVNQNGTVREIKEILIQKELIK